MNRYVTRRLVASALRHIDEAENKLSRVLDLPGVPADLHQRVDGILVQVLQVHEQLYEIDDELAGVPADEVEPTPTDR
jgi:hypothetical protein